MSVRRIFRAAKHFRKYCLGKAAVVDYERRRLTLLQIQITELFVSLLDGH